MSILVNQSAPWCVIVFQCSDDSVEKQICDGRRRLSRFYLNQMLSWPTTFVSHYRKMNGGAAVCFHFCFVYLQVCQHVSVYYFAPFTAMSAWHQYKHPYHERDLHYQHFFMSRGQSVASVYVCRCLYRWMMLPYTVTVQSSPQTEPGPDSPRDASMSVLSRNQTCTKKRNKVFKRNHTFQHNRCSGFSYTKDWHAPNRNNVTGRSSFKCIILCTRSNWDLIPLFWSFSQNHDLTNNYKSKGCRLTYTVYS